MCPKMSEASPCTWDSLTWASQHKPAKARPPAHPKAEQAWASSHPCWHHSGLPGTTTLSSSADEPAVPTLSDCSVEMDRLENFFHVIDQLNSQGYFYFIYSPTPPRVISSGLENSILFPAHGCMQWPCLVYCWGGWYQTNPTLRSKAFSYCPQSAFLLCVPSYLI